MSLITWVDADDCYPPHGLDLTTAHDAEKVNMLMEAFATEGFDKSKPALVGYPFDGKVQLLSGTHRHEAARRVGIQLPVTLWLQSSIEDAWGLPTWVRVVKDIPVEELEHWTREDLEKRL